jgi:methylmalonyl-CoA/ethylmalonyl-CoA epimerase
MVERIRQIAIVVQDMPRAVAFYRDVLGLRFLFDAGPRLAFFDCGGVRLMLAPPEGSETHNPSSILYYLVKDIKGTAQELVNKGAAMIGQPHLIAKMPDHDLWLAEFRDGEGNTFALMAEREQGAE